MVEVRYVVRDEERGASQTPHALFAADAKPAEKRRNREDDRIEEREAQPREGEALRPRGVRVMSRRLRLAAAANDALDVAERGRRGEARLVNLDLVAVFERAQKLDPSERVELGE